jgi:hypothetical protein
MALDVRRQCAVCAWREDCTKKHTIKETALHCPDYCRDLRLQAEPSAESSRGPHKQIEDVFGEKRS